MKAKQTIATSLAVAGLALAGLATTASANDSGKITTDKMIGIPATMSLDAGNIRGINGGGLPWGIGEAKVSVKTSGKIDADFENLVFTAGPNSGKNTVGSMSVVVSCLDASNQPVNVKSAPFPVTVATATDPGGDADVKTSIELPSPCFAPIVFITNAAGTAWFAVDGL